MGNLKSSMTREEWGFLEKIHMIERDLTTGVARLCVVNTAKPSIFFGFLCYSHVWHCIDGEELEKIMNNKTANIIVKKDNNAILLEISITTDNR